MLLSSAARTVGGIGTGGGLGTLLGAYGGGGQMGDPSCGPGAYGGDPNMGGGYPPEEFVPVPAHAQTTSDVFIPVNPDIGGDDFVPIDPSQPGDGYVAEGDGGGVGLEGAGEVSHRLQRPTTPHPTHR